MNWAFPIPKIFEYDPKSWQPIQRLNFPHIISYWSGTCCHKSVSVVTGRQADTGGRQWDTMLLSGNRGRQCCPQSWMHVTQSSRTGAMPEDTHTHIHAHTDLWWNWLCRRTEAPTLPPWWGRPIRARAKEHTAPVWGEHLWPPSTHTNNYKERSAHKNIWFNKKISQCFPQCVQGKHCSWV